MVDTLRDFPVEGYGSPMATCATSAHQVAFFMRSRCIFLFRLLRLLCLRLGRPRSNSANAGERACISLRMLITQGDETVKCPSCSDKQQQQTVGTVDRIGQGKVTPTLFRCGLCGFLYLVPPLDGKDQQQGKPATS